MGVQLLLGAKYLLSNDNIIKRVTKNYDLGRFTLTASLILSHLDHIASTNPS
jgi:hypothetical protein